MRYLLLVGFSCDVYQREPRARIFIGDKLIDEFYIQYEKNTYSPPNVHANFLKSFLQPNSRIKQTNMIIKSFPSYRFYELEIDTKLDQTELCIEIKNNDSNSTNGFMTNSTLIRLRVCYFFPFDQKLLLRLNEISKKKSLRQNYAWIRSNKNEIFDLVRNGLCWQGKNGQILYNKRDYLGSHQIGGDGVFTCELVKKYKILTNKIKKSSRYHFPLFLINYFIDKYQQHANQRNSD